MLLYNKAFDINHTILRICSWLLNSSDSLISPEKIRIFDFLIAFPEYISKLSLGKELVKERNKFKKFSNPYNEFDAQSLFHQMEGIQKSAICSLLAASVLIEVSNDLYEIKKDRLYEIGFVEINVFNSINNDVIAFISDNLEALPVTGGAGIKATSKLMSFKYDRI
ncbi:ABC-three component system middle component 5 [Brenneria populi subsp. brevivirga]|uniref:ABC-three component system middle component 5 n=1 Tax=Brenneria populi TaxID=1505588 RepID=UPI002E17FE20|nr:ABC-three component system middle component 5 [Brenneria populi subsp. brevivirga]